MTKQKKLYEIRRQMDGLGTQSISPKLREYRRAKKLAAYLRRRFGVKTYLASWMVAA
jgi:hypothetical protein